MQPFNYGGDSREFLVTDRASMLRWLLFSNLNGLRLFLETIEDLVEAEEAREIAEIKKRCGDNIDWSSEYPAHWQDVIAAQLRMSFVVSLMATTEWFLDQLADDTAAVLSIQRTTRQKGHNTIGTARSLFVDHAMFVTPPPSVWDFVALTYKLRNSIVHRQGVSDDSTVEVLAALATMSPALAVTSATDLSRQFCKEAHERVDELFSALFLEHEQLCDRFRRSRNAPSDGSAQHSSE